MPDMDTALKEAMQIEGAIGVALVDYTSGMALGTLGSTKELDLTVAAAGNTDVVRDLIAEKVRATDGRITAKRLLVTARAGGFVGSDRNFRRAVAKAKKLWARQRRIYRPWVPVPGEHLVIDWCTDGGWQVNEWAKKAILLLFQLRDLEAMEVGPFEYLDRIPLKRDYAERGVRAALAIRDAVAAYRVKVDALAKETPYAVPYKPDIWGAGWNIQRFGWDQWMLHLSFPDLFPRTYALHALSFILGVHPGSNTASFVSGVGAKSLTAAYGFNRADWSHIPGGSASGTALIRPDFPELKHWPFFWQQTEYVLGRGTTDYLLLVLAADYVLNR